MNLVEFQDGDRTFTCEASSSPATPGTMWWWMRVTGESQRYAAFRTAPTDTQANLRTRIIAYYAQLLADRERPREIRGHWAQRRQQPAADASADAKAGADSTTALGSGTNGVPPGR